MLKLSKAVSEENPSEDVSPKIHGFTYHCLPEVLQAAYQNGWLEDFPINAPNWKKKGRCFVRIAGWPKQQRARWQFCEIAVSLLELYEIIGNFSFTVYVIYIVHSIFNALAVAEAWKAVAPCMYMSTNTFWKRITSFCWCVQQKSLVYQAYSGIFVYENALSCVFCSSNSLSIHDSFQPGAKESSKQRSAQHSACCWRQTSRKYKFFDRTHVNKLVSLTQKITKNPSVWT